MEKMSLRAFNPFQEAMVLVNLGTQSGLVSSCWGSTLTTSLSDSPSSIIGAIMSSHSGQDQQFPLTLGSVDQIDSEFDSYVETLICEWDIHWELVYEVVVQDLPHLLILYGKHETKRDTKELAWNIYRRIIVRMNLELLWMESQPCHVTLAAAWYFIIIDYYYSD